MLSDIIVFKSNGPLSMLLSWALSVASSGGLLSLKIVILRRVDGAGNQVSYEASQLVSYYLGMVGSLGMVGLASAR